MRWAGYQLMLHVTTVSGHVFRVNMLYGASDLQSGGEIGALHLENRRCTPENWYLTPDKCILSATRRRRLNVMQQQCKTDFANNVMVTLRFQTFQRRWLCGSKLARFFSHDLACNEGYAIGWISTHAARYYCLRTCFQSQHVVWCVRATKRWEDRYFTPAKWALN